ncbi:GNAT family N-acetyltransferase [Methylobacterium nonmethylotrophicum]|uniref:GNAT family N-acetyltransferase n=1 Tax=Methylobacterium nonmethylotrophicum TaxID=1141884 RepID=A0A4Z0NV53_9HYPH|nr:GNAT family N-acetyltransferase [Methylobacterium nonmethylotrophicum]TGE00246.1 GNAT family N-acetyltransferase [Methylobacterium nonmethylotrophicum]
MTPQEHWALWRSDTRATPFQSPAWLDAWWTHLGGGDRRDAEIRDPAGRLVAALPLFVWHDGGVRRLVPVGAGHSDYCDALVAPGTATEPLWTAILGSAAAFDEVLLPDLRPDSPLLGPPPAGWSATDTEAEICPVLTLPPGGSPLDGLTRSQRRKVVHDRHRAERLGGVTEELVTAGRVDGLLDALFALHSSRWAREGQPGVLADPRVQAFHRAAAPALAEAGLLRMAVVRHEGAVAAVVYGLADGARWYSYINAVDMRVPGQSFGTLAFACLIEAAASRGAGEFHFLRGDEPYKARWGAAPRRTIRRILRRA